MDPKALFLAAIVGFLGLVAAADAQQATPSTAPAPPADDPDQIICKSMPPPTGTRLGGGRECHTKREWDQQLKESQEAVAHAEQKGLMGSGSGR